MKSLKLSLILMVIAIQVTNAQVRRQFEDTAQATTTVVIKDDAAADEDVLLSLEWGDISMSQEVRIDTERYGNRRQKQAVEPAQQVVASIEKVVVENPAPKVEPARQEVQQVEQAVVAAAPQPQAAATYKSPYRSVSKPTGTPQTCRQKEVGLLQILMKFSIFGYYMKSLCPERQRLF